MKLVTEQGMSGFEELPEWISTHPSNASRVEKFNEIIPKVNKLAMWLMAQLSCMCKISNDIVNDISFIIT